jgi:pyruvate dehydrogenase E1 component
MDEPESLGAIGLAAREKLDNLVFVINCNLQRLDGPVRGNGKIIQELEGEFRGAGWNVIKLLWGKGWDELLARDKTASCAADDGDAGRRLPGLQGQRRRLRAQALLRQVPRDRQAGRAHERRRDLELRRGGHDPQKVYAAFHAANDTRASPPCCWSRPSRATAWARPARQEHRAPDQEADDEDIKYIRDRFNIPIPTASWTSCPTTSRPTTRRK